MSDHKAVTEAELQEKSTGKRVTLDALKDNILSAHCFTALDAANGAGEVFEDEHQIKSLSLLTICVIVLKNGFTVMGQSACADPANFNKEVGERLAREDAQNKIWPLMGYALKQEVFLTQGENGTFKGRVRKEELELSDKITKLEAFTNGHEQFDKLDNNEKDNLLNQLQIMKQYRHILQQRMAGF